MILKTFKSHVFEALSIALMTSLYGASSFADEPSPIYIESLSRSAAVTLVSGSSNSPAVAGAALAPGDRLQTHDGSVRIVYPDGSNQTLGRNSELEIKAPEASAENKMIYVSYLHAGFVHARAKHQANPNEEPHFIIESKTVVVGVRGTEFTMGSDSSGEVQVHTLEGRVAVANERAKIKEAQLYSPGELAVLKGGQIAPPQKFNLMEYRKKINSEHPEVHKLIYNKVLAQKEIKPARARATRRVRTPRRGHK